ncbi:hypothetical protein FOA52_012097 [Chlamydomonas sp. UWO 241]|nr:hypothetical protein FOA52_012097 [Chlamydomonas sp. UWO 241]
MACSVDTPDGPSWAPTSPQQGTNGRRTLAGRRGLIDGTGDHSSPRAHPHHRSLLTAATDEYGADDPGPLPEEENASLPPALRASSYQPHANGSAVQNRLPNCTVCRGCNTHLIKPPSLLRDEGALVTVLNTSFKMDRGKTNAWLFCASTNVTSSGEAVVKVYCLPLEKYPGATIPTRCPTHHVLRNARVLLSIQKVVDECGFNDIVPRLWVDKVNAPVPGHGYHVDWHGLWQEVASGVSMFNSLWRGEPERVPRATIMQHYNDKLSKTQVVRAAIFDLLTSQCDRHSGNIFINDDGNMQLIDKDVALGYRRRKTCGVDSVFVPTTELYQETLLGTEFVDREIEIAEAKTNPVDPLVLLDYRCWVDGGKIGKSYPPQVHQCLSSIASHSVADNQEHFGFPDPRPAWSLTMRARAMLTDGFESAYLICEPSNLPHKRHALQPPCCHLALDADGKFECGQDAWERLWELPALP